MMRLRTVLALFLLLAVPALAAETPLADPAAEARAQTVFRDLRCMVCQSQSVADSDAPFAADLRGWVRTRVAAGQSKAEIERDLAARYGDRILMRPPFKPATWLLWLMPLLLLAAGGALLFGYFKGGGK